MQAIRHPLRTWLALLALVLQPIVSFGHMHRGDLLAGGYERGPLAGLANLARAPVPGSDQPAKPGEHEGLCTICASMALAGSLLAPTSPAIPPAIAQPENWLADLAAALGTDAVRTPHQARAPPA
jgi:Protein of unknown function (DUF2946)